MGVPRGRTRIHSRIRNSIREFPMREDRNKTTTMMSGALKGHRKSQVGRLNGFVWGIPRPLGLAAVPNVPEHYITNFHSINNCHEAAHSLEHTHSYVYTRICTRTQQQKIRFLTLAREQKRPAKETTGKEAPVQRALRGGLGDAAVGCCADILTGVGCFGECSKISGGRLLLWDRPRECVH